MIQKFHFWRYDQKNWKQGLKTHVHSSVIHNTQQVKTTQVSKYQQIYIYHILFIHSSVDTWILGLFLPVG